MPLSDFKQLETGFYVVWVCRYKTPAHVNKTREAQKDPQMAKHDYYETRFLSNESAHAYQDRHVPRDRSRISWHKSEAAAKAVLDVLSKEVVPYEWGMLDDKAPLNPHLHILEISKEVCVFDGDGLHTLSGKRWPLADVETCIARFEKASADDILKMYGKHRRVQRPCWQTCLCWVTCLCCFDGYFGCSRRA